MWHRAATQALVVLVTALAGTAAAEKVSDGVVRQLPPGFDVISTAEMPSASDGLAFKLLVLARHGEVEGAHGPKPAAPRPLLVFRQQPHGTFRLVARNDTVVLRSDEGGQCDPFLDGGAVIAVKGLYFTIENGVACGSHWTDYVTFRFDHGLGRFVFDNERSESWSLNTSTDDNADALVPDGPPHVRRATRARPVLFEDWRPRH